jgi:hypothetical protein
MAIAPDDSDARMRARLSPASQQAAVDRAVAEANAAVERALAGSAPTNFTYGAGSAPAYKAPTNFTYGAGSVPTYQPSTTPSPQAKDTSIPAINNRNNPPGPARTGYKWQWFSMAKVNNPYGGEWREVSTGTNLNQPAAGNGTGTNTTGTIPAAPTGPTLAINTFKNTLALFFGQGEVAKSWVNELYKLASPYYKTGASVNEALNLALQEGRNNPNLKEFTTRFSGIFKLQDKLVSGVAVTVPTIAEYVASEAKMGEVLGAAGLGSLNTQQFLGERIGDGLNVSEFTRRINDVYLRIDSLPQQAKSTINRYLPTIDKTQLAKALLTGTKGAVELAKEVSSYEVLSAAEQQGLGTLTTEGKAGLAGGVDLAQAAELSAIGYTFNTANQALSQVAQAAPTYEKILEMRTGQDIASGEAAQMLIQADVKKLASAERAKAQAIAEEAARFAGGPGTSKVSFSRQRSGSF